MTLYDKETVISMWAEGKQSGEIAAALSMSSPEAARTIVRRARLKGDKRVSEYRKDGAPRRLDHDVALNMWAEGGGYGDIAEAIGTTEGTVVQIIFRARKRGDRRAHLRRQPTPRSDLLNHDWWAAEARKCGMSINVLRKRLLKIIETDGLVQALLDEEPQ